MCLVNVSKRMIAKENLVVYKHFLWINQFGIRASYQQFMYDVNVLYVQSEPIQISYGDIYRAFHSYPNVDDAMSHTEPTRICIIPKGSVYYEGYFYAKDSIASNKIIVTSIPANKAKTFNADEYLKKNKITKTIKV